MQIISIENYFFSLLVELNNLILLLLSFFGPYCAAEENMYQSG